MAPPNAFSTADVAPLATPLPEVTLKESDGWTSIRFRDKGFAWVNHGEDTAMIKASKDERAALLATAPDVYQAGWESGSSAWVTVHVPLADPEEVRELLEEAWRMTAPQGVVSAYDASRAPL